MNGLPGWAKVAAPAIVGIIGILAATMAGGGDDNGGAGSATTLVGAGEIFLEPVGEVGNDPYTPPVSDAPATTTTVAETTTTTAAPTAGDATSVGVQGVAGGRPGLYGGTRNNASCDKEQLIQFLEGDAAKGAAWAEVQGIEPANIRSFIESLTPVVLTDDTRVTNHGFRSGRATPKQSVLEAGSAVLVDDRGGPRARCFCGNPLLPPNPVSGQATYVGKAWPGFAPADVKVVVPEKQPLQKLVLTDTATGAPFARAIGSAGEADTEADATTVTSAATTTTALVSDPTGNIPEPNAIVTDEGDVAVESEYSDQYPKELATDHDTGTSWFSAGEADGQSTTFTWTNDRDDLITLVRIIGNGDNEDASIRSGFGFDAVLVKVLDEAGDVDFEETVSLDGTPDPTVQVRPGVEGRTVVLELIGHEDPTCGGFSELEIGVTR